MLYCSSKCGSISIMRSYAQFICNTYVYTFHVCLCLLALTFVCNSTYLFKCSFQYNIHSKNIFCVCVSSFRTKSLRNNVIMTSSHDVLITSGHIRITPTLNSNYFRRQSAGEVLLPSCQHKSQLMKKGTLFHLLQTNVIAR